jgi:prepilin-type N-terminal cleavage/methylation domain-containing protein/prepilin-type processing-associated H-X9-DG protein
MNRQKGFTLIELLVVIAIVALLLSVMMPALKKAKQKAQAVVCSSNLKQFGILFAMYASDNEERFCDGGDNGGEDWPNFLRPYYDLADIRCCPIASKIKNDPAVWGMGSTTEPWGPWPDPALYWQYPGDYGSYGINIWICWMDGGGIWTDGLAYADDYWGKTTGFTGVSANAVPILSDSAWCGLWVEAGGPITPPPEPDVFDSSIANFVINRHNGHVNMLFADFTVRKVGLKELWTLKWHRSFNTANEWTIAGGVGRAGGQDWPQWMQGFKDY